METQSSKSRYDRGLLAALLLVAGVTFPSWFPDPHQYQDEDELSYMMVGTEVFQGLSPAYHYTFSGPEAWVSWTYTAASSARYFIFPTAEEAAVDPQVRPYVAINHAIWDIYNDTTPLRLV